MNRALFLLCITLSGFCRAVPAADPAVAPRYSKTGVLTFEDRVRAQTRIEKVWYEHRIWPKENPGPKPPFERMLPPAAIRAKVATALRESAALERIWNRPLTAAALQAELRRMARDTRDAGTLRALFAALDDDPALLAETLARQSLADRLVRRWYARDDRFHAEARAAAQRAARTFSGAGGQYLKVTYTQDETPLQPVREAPGEITVAPEAFAARRRLDPPAGELSGVEETDEAFVITRTIASSNERHTVETLNFPKRSFDDWWRETANSLPAEVATPDLPAPQGEPLPAVPSVAGCNSWDDPFRINRSPEGRYNHTALWTGTEMIIWGGYFSSGGRYNPATDSWLPVAVTAATPAGSGGASAVWTGTEMIVWGGRDAVNYAVQNSGGRYNPATDSWVATSNGAGTPAARFNHSAVWTGSVMVIWGGQDSLSAPLNSGGRYNAAGNSWQATSTGLNTPSPRNNSTVVWSGTTMIVWGGYDPGSGYLNSGGRYNPSSDSWMPVTVSGNTPTPRYYHSAVWTGGEMIVWGGQDGGGYSNSGGRYNPSSDSWLPTPVNGSTPAPRSIHAAVWSGSEMIVWGGNAPSASNTGGRYNPATGVWTPTSTGANVPQGRFWHTAVWSGTEMIVWGGLNLGTSFASGGRYSPASDSWVATSKGPGVPASRYLHSMVWTGAEAIVWGGYSTTYDNSGGRFNPALNSWTATSLTGAVPSGRLRHKAVWTGSEMIVWGGTDAGYPNTGGRYNPATDSWSATRADGSAPQGRTYHSAVWSGTEMIIWGGNGCPAACSDLNDGARYAPGTDSWSVTSTGSGAPSPRSLHSAVWTGSEMIVWGGSGTGGPFSTGGRYAPASDSWQATQPAGYVPERRTGHSAVWTGTEMIVWGGIGAAGYLNSGGRYNPAGDSWLPVAEDANVPSQRVYHSAVWTGAEMIIWAGNYSNTVYNTGGRYSPVGDHWAPIATAGAPAARSNQAAVWTGAELIAWGGSDGNGQALGSGGIYTSGSAGSPGNSLKLTRTSGVNLAWSAAGGATGYNVKRCSGFGGFCYPTAVIATPSGNAYSEPGDANSYFYAVEAVNACGATP